MDAAPDTPAEGPVDARTAGAGAGHTLAVVVVCLAVGVVGLNTTAVGVLGQGMADELDLSFGELEWVVGAYLVAGAAFALIGGRLGDIIGRRTTLAAGIAVLALGSGLALVATGQTVLVIGRAVQGVGAALVLPATIEVVAATAGARGPQRGFRARGIAYATAFGIGPLVGGLLSDQASWRAVFALELVVLAVGGALCVPLLRHAPPRPAPATRDLRGGLLVAALVVVVVLVASRGHRWGWTSPAVLGAAALAAVLAVALVHLESRAEHPLLHPGLLRDHVVLGANVATLAASIGMLGLIYFFNAFATSSLVFDSTAMAVAAALVPFTVSVVAFAVLAGALSHRLGFRGPAVVGLALSALGFWLLSRVGPGVTEEQVAIPLALCGIGSGIANAGLTSPAVLAVPRTRLDEAAGLVSLTRFLGSALAIALGTAAYLAAAARAGIAPTAPPAEAVLGGSAYERAVRGLQADLRAPFEAATRAGTVDAFAATMRVTALVVTLLLVVSAVLLRPRRRVEVAGASG